MIKYRLAALNDFDEVRAIENECFKEPYSDEDLHYEFEKNPEPEVLLPHFSCHNLRHTFTTRLVEAGTNIKVAQTVLGHRDIKTTLDIYADCTQEMLDKEFNSLEGSFRVS